MLQPYLRRDAFLHHHLKHDLRTVSFRHEIKPQSLRLHRNSSPSYHFSEAARIVVTIPSFSDAVLLRNESSMRNNGDFRLYCIFGL
ncbi:hypothetical protein Bca52824_000126 [Brassica carinata]|uniref:Uncharacterized protein n=1 Tax=Brassica carinata TaxID=52824 RepID=A0A8X7WG96_BRACI|nr:hypothetical protein Bca52824_000126 [Brassica carinata]